MPDEAAQPNDAETAPPSPRPEVPDWDVRNCLVCSQPMISRHCKYRCLQCSYIIDCSDPY